MYYAGSDRVRRATEATPMKLLLGGKCSECSAEGCSTQEINSKIKDGRMAKRAMAFQRCLIRVCLVLGADMPARGRKPELLKESSKLARSNVSGTIL